jgi:hypothetical protein
LANTTPGQDEIILAAGTYDISAYTGTRDNDFKSVNGVVTNGLPVIKTDIIIRGASADTTFITRNGTATYRLFHVAAGATLTLRKLTLSKGNVGTQDIGGGAVEVFGTGLFEDCRFGPDNKSNYGGAIVNGGTTTIERCDICNNEADWGGGVYNADGGTMKIYNTLIANNKAITNSGVPYYAGGVYNSNNLLIDHCCIMGNKARWGGGVMSNRVLAQTTIKRSIISNNDAQEGAGVYSGFGPITVEDTTLMDNTGWSGRIAFRRDAQPITLTRCHFPTNYVEIPAQGSIYPNDLWYVTVSNVKYPWRAKFKMLQTSAQALECGYEYDAQRRAAAANYAITESQANFDTFPTGNGNRVLGSIAEYNVGGTYRYNVLTHESLVTAPEGATGSAFFISETLHLGGCLPMTKADNDPNTTRCDLAPGPQENMGTIGWRVCCEEGTTNSPRGSTGPWRTHNRLAEYFAAYGGTVFNANTAGITQAELVPYIDFQNGGVWESGQSVNGAQYLHNLFKSGGQFGNVKTGDYIILNLGSNGYHGFLIVGWGPARQCKDAINVQIGFDPTTFSVDRRNDTQEVPYVADFCFGRDNIRTGWLQDPRPRPFYSSVATISEAILSGNPSAYGYSLPDYFDRFRYKPSGFQPFTGNIPLKWQFIRLPDTVRVLSSKVYRPTSGC